MIIGACGFGSTGSSVVTDYLCEFDNIQVLDKIEFSWVSGVDGLIDLDFHVNHPHTRTADSILALYRYMERCKKKMRAFSKDGGIDPIVFMNSTARFLDSITQVKWDWYIREDHGFFVNNLERIAIKFIRKYEKLKQRQLHCWPLTKVGISVMPKQFDEAARIHVRELIKAMGGDFSKPIILDQPFAGNNPQACFKFFDDPYAIVMDRDPRDNYVFANTRLMGMNHFMPIQPVEDFVKYYRVMRDNQPYKDSNERVLVLQFEDMVYHYDETTERLRKFLNLEENPAPKTIFDPDLSIANTQVWKRFPQFAKDIEYIEKELPEYLFDFSRCPVPDFNKKMFRGKSPKHK